MSQHSINGTISAQGPTPSIKIYKGGNFAIWGTFSAVVKIESSYDNGANWLVVSKNTNGDEAAFSAPVNLSFDEPERDVLYRLNCTSFVSGPINYRISGDLA